MIYIVFGLLIVLKSVQIRFSPAGRVCSGDYLKKFKKDTTWLEHQDYYMIYEGFFIIILFVLEGICFSVMSITYVWTHMTSQHIDLLYG